MAQQLGRYELLESLGAGATAEVFRAKDTLLGREVALKVLKPALVSDATAFARFAQEAQAAAQLFHPHIALVLDMGSAGDRYFIAMRLVPGRALDKVLAEEGPLPWAEVLRLAEQIGGALAFAHERGFLHRDVKPANIIRTPEGEYVLTDFGLTRAMMATGLTSDTGAVLGTPAYIPPEIWLGEKATPATDEYALACVLVEALTGAVLFEGDTPPAVMTRHVLKGAELPETWVPPAPEGVGAVFAKALSKVPNERYGGPAALAQALQSIATGISPPGKRHGIPASNTSTPDLSVQQLTTNTRQPVPSNECVLTLVPGTDMIFVRIPVGEFLLGSDPNSDPGAFTDEQPQQRVYLNEYCVGKHPITNRQYEVFVQHTGHKPPQHWGQNGIPEGTDEHPVVCVSWEDATAFCAWVSQMTRHKLRLPTEAEWEKAARGNDGRIYPWGNEEPDTRRCNFADHEHAPTPVGKYIPYDESPYGCADMAGNVWEWCTDWFDSGYYHYMPQRDPLGPAHGDYRVARGGSWLHSERYLRCAYRAWFAPFDFKNYIGFRCVMEQCPAP